jgi:hypothetical protein
MEFDQNRRGENGCFPLNGKPSWLGDRRGSQTHNGKQRFSPLHFKNTCFHQRWRSVRRAGARERTEIGGGDGASADLASKSGVGARSAASPPCPSRSGSLLVLFWKKGAGGGGRSGRRKTEVLCRWPPRHGWQLGLVGWLRGWAPRHRTARAHSAGARRFALRTLRGKRGEELLCRVSRF